MINRTKYIILIVFILFVVLIGYRSFNIMLPKDIKGNIKIMANDNNYDYLKNAADEFMENNKKVNISIERKSDNEILNYLKDGNYENSPDLITINSKRLRNLDEKALEKINYANDIIESYNKNFNFARINEIGKGKDYLAVPIQSNPQILMIREDLLNEYGYKLEDIRTWKDLIDLAKNIKDKSQGKIDLFSYNDITIQEIEHILFYEGANVNEKDEISSLIKNEDVMGKASPLCYIANKNNYKTIINNNKDNSLKAIMIPAIMIGGNRSVVLDGDNIAMLKNDNDEQDLSSRFITFLISNQSLMEKMFSGDGGFFPSSRNFYSNAIMDTKFKKLNGQQLWNIVTNVANRQIEISDYSKFDELINSSK